MKISSSAIEEFYEVLGQEMFESDDGWEGRLNDEFNQWANAHFPEYYEEHADDICELEIMVKTEEETGVISEFVNSLDDDRRRVAITSMIRMLELSELQTEPIYKKLEEIADD